MENDIIIKSDDTIPSHPDLNTFTYQEDHIGMGWPRSHSYTTSKTLRNVKTGAYIILPDEGWKETEYGKEIRQTKILAFSIILTLGILGFFWFLG